MAEIWGYDFKNGWSEEYDFILEYSVLNQEQDLDKVITSLGYGNTYDVFKIEDHLLGHPLQVYEITRDSTLPRYLIEFCPSGNNVDYFTCRNIPSLIELLGKLAPLIHASIACNQINDEMNEKFA